MVVRMFRALGTYLIGAPPRTPARSLAGPPYPTPLPRGRAVRALVSSAVISALIVAALGAISQDSQKPEVKSTEDVKAEETFTRNCVRCHPADRINGSRRTRTQWEEVMTTMQTARGAIIPDEDWDVILNYLVKEHGRVNVNRATIDDLVEVLGVTSQTADTIVKYRKEHGNFEDFDAFAKVPGLDLTKIEKKRDAISF